MRYKADSELFEVVTVFGREALFSCNRIERDSVPKGLYQYEVRHDDCCQGIPCEVAKGVLVNFWGTLLTRTEISEVEKEDRRYIMDDEWAEEEKEYTLKDWLERGAAEV